MSNRNAAMILAVTASMAMDVPAMPELTRTDRAPWARPGRGPARRKWNGDTKASRKTSPRFTNNGRKLKRKKRSR